LLRSRSDFHHGIRYDYVAKTTRDVELENDTRGIVEFFYGIHQGVGWLGVGERYYLSLQKKFRTVDPCPGTNSSQLGRDFFGEKLKGDVRRILDENVYRKAQRQFSNISG